jgi:hypothetical protein
MSLEELRGMFSGDVQNKLFKAEGDKLSVVSKGAVVKGWFWERKKIAQQFEYGGNYYFVDVANKIKNKFATVKDELTKKEDTEGLKELDGYLKKFDDAVVKIQKKKTPWVNFFSKNKALQAVALGLIHNQLAAMKKKESEGIEQADEPESESLKKFASLTELHDGMKKAWHSRKDVMVIVEKAKAIDLNDQNAIKELNQCIADLEKSRDFFTDLEAGKEELNKYLDKDLRKEISTLKSEINKLPEGSVERNYKEACLKSIEKHVNDIKFQFPHEKYPRTSTPYTTEDFNLGFAKWKEKELNKLKDVLVLAKGPATVSPSIQIELDGLRKDGVITQTEFRTYSSFEPLDKLDAAITLYSHLTDRAKKVQALRQERWQEEYNEIASAVERASELVTKIEDEAPRLQEFLKKEGIELDDREVRSFSEQMSALKEQASKEGLPAQDKSDPTKADFEALRSKKEALSSSLKQFQVQSKSAFKEALGTIIARQRTILREYEDWSHDEKILVRGITFVMDCDRQLKAMAFGLLHYGSLWEIRSSGSLTEFLETNEAQRVANGRKKT